jgi:hypothetical protein
MAFWQPGPDMAPIGTVNLRQLFTCASATIMLGFMFPLIGINGLQIRIR